MKIQKDITFEVGDRYRNRLGWYEVLEIEGENLRVRYESDGREDTLPIELQQRILFNISQEEKSITPYMEDENNRRYFQTIGYLTNNGFIEAIIPPKSQCGFDSTFRRIKGRYPRDQEEGYYLHHDPNVDKWGIEMRLTLKVPKNISVGDLDFGPSVNIVGSPKYDELRINSNSFCWRLLSLGFELGWNHDISKIESNIPDQYRQSYREGISIT